MCECGSKNVQAPELSVVKPTVGMARVAVLHNTLDFQGGADAVCLQTCAALAADHAVTLFTISETDPEALATRFGVSLGELTVVTPRGNGPLAKTLSAAAPWTGPQLAFRSVLLRRLFARHADGFDLAVSTANELALPLPSVQFIHYPQFRERRRRWLGVDPDATGGPSEWLNECWSRLAAPAAGEPANENTLLLANSAWTADVVDDTYGVRPAVVHPPVDQIDCSTSWAEREDGIVAVGRLAPDKRVMEAIAVVDALRERGYDSHLHVVGSAPRSYRRYAEKVAETAARREYVTLERDASRSRLETLLCSHRYGLNMKPREHFGMAVAEYAAAGMVAIAPDSGGQREIVDASHRFDSLSGAVDCLADAIDSGEPPTASRDRFASERFRAAMRGAVARAID